MPRSPRSQVDPFEREIELAFEPGDFIPNREKTMNNGSWLASCSANLLRQSPMKAPAAMISRRCYLGAAAAGCAGLFLPVAFGDEAS